MPTKAKGKYYRKKIRHPVTGEYKDVYGKTRAELQDKCDSIQSAWAREIEDAESPYFFQYAADWFARMAGDMTPARREHLAREINSVICPVIGGKRLREINSDDVLDVMATRKGLSRSAQEKTLQLLRRILQAAENAGKIQRNPARDLRPGGKPAPRKEALTAAQQKALLSAVDGLPIELFIRLGLYTGLRREEILGLAWKDVRLDGPCPEIDVRQALRWVRNNRPEISPTLKSAAAWRTVPIPPPLLPALSAAREAAKNGAQEPPGGRTVVSGPDGSPWSYQTFRRAWGAVDARTAGLVKVKRKEPETGETVTVEVERTLGETVPKHPGVVISLDFDVTPHILRHTYATELIRGGVNVKRVQYLLGHESSAVTMEIYAHYMGHTSADLRDDVAGVFPG